MIIFTLSWKRFICRNFKITHEKLYIFRKYVHDSSRLGIRHNDHSIIARVDKIHQNQMIFNFHVFHVSNICMCEGFMNTGWPTFFSFSYNSLCLPLSRVSKWLCEIKQALLFINSLLFLLLISITFIIYARNAVVKI